MYAANEFYNNGGLVTVLNGSGDATPTLYVSGDITNNDGIINNDNSFLEINSGNFHNISSSYYYQSTGKERFSGAVNNTISGAWNGTSLNRNQFYHLKIHKTSTTGENIILGTVTGNTVNINAAGTLEFTSANGIIRTQISSVTSAPYTGNYTNAIYIQNPSTAAIIGHNTAIASKTKYIEGKLRRQVNTNGTYFFPIGVVNTGLDGMEAFSLTFNAAPTSKSILGYIQPGSQAVSNRNVLCDVGRDPGAGNDPFANCVGSPDGIYDLYQLDAANDLSHEWIANASDAIGTIDYDATFYPGTVLDVLSKYYTIPNACSTPYQTELIRVVAKDGIVGGTRQLGPGNWAPWKHITANIWCDFSANQQAITLAGQSSFSTFRIHGTVPSGVTALPVELVHFSIQAVNNEYFDLTWETASEQNNAGFYLQRSDNDGTTFENISWIAGNGNSTLPQAYAFSDKNVEANKIYYYRLQQVDFDQTYSYSNILSGKLEGTTIDAVHVFPNPTTDITQATIYSSKDGDLTISIYDVLGSQIKNIPTQLTKGNNTIDIDVRDLAASTYLVQFIFNDNITTKKIIKK